MVDREARDKLSDVIRAYMDDKIVSDDLDNFLLFRNLTKDETVEYIAHDLFFYYDDFVDHHIVASKELWDYFNRLLLLLESDGEITFSTHWSIRQLIAAFCLAGMLMLAHRWGVGKDLLTLLYPVGIITLIWTNLLSRKLTKREKAENSIAPFSSIANLLAIRRRVPTFSKHFYPQVLQQRRIRSKFKEMIVPLFYIAAAPMLCPLFICRLILPDKKAHVVC